MDLGNKLLVDAFMLNALVHPINLHLVDQYCFRHIDILHLHCTADCLFKVAEQPCQVFQLVGVSS